MLNVGNIRNTSTELSATVQPIQTAALNWTVGASYSRNDNIVLKLDQQSLPLLVGSEGSVSRGGALTATQGRIVVGYPLFGRWARPIASYNDDNGDGIIQVSEIRLGDTAVYLGRQDPAYTATLTTDVRLFHGRVGVHANVYRRGNFSQLNLAGGKSTFLSVANEPNATLGQQAAYVAATCGGSNCTPYGLVQTVGSWEFQSLSVNVAVPPSVARWFHASSMALALQGSNLGLWTNYRGKDPNVNSLPNGNLTADAGQLPLPRTWKLQLTLGN
jgi:hypothetical protein